MPLNLQPNVVSEIESELRSLAKIIYLVRSNIYLLQTDVAEYGSNRVVAKYINDEENKLESLIWSETQLRTSLDQNIVNNAQEKKSKNLSSPTTPFGFGLFEDQEAEHEFSDKNFINSVNCDHCGSKITLKGARCNLCNFACHIKCVAFVRPTCGLTANSASRVVHELLSGQSPGSSTNGQWDAQNNTILMSRVRSSSFRSKTENTNIVDRNEKLCMKELKSVSRQNSERGQTYGGDSFHLGAAGLVRSNGKAGEMSLPASPTHNDKRHSVKGVLRSISVTRRSRSNSLDRRTEKPKVIQSATVSPKHGEPNRSVGQRGSLNTWMKKSLFRSYSQKNLYEVTPPSLHMSHQITEPSLSKSLQTNGSLKNLNEPGVHSVSNGGTIVAAPTLSAGLALVTKAKGRSLNVPSYDDTNFAVSGPLNAGLIDDDHSDTSVGHVDLTKFSEDRLNLYGGRLEEFQSLADSYNLHGLRSEDSSPVTQRMNFSLDAELGPLHDRFLHETRSRDNSQLTAVAEDHVLSTSHLLRTDSNADKLLDRHTQMDLNDEFKKIATWQSELVYNEQAAYNSGSKERYLDDEEYYGTDQTDSESDQDYSSFSENETDSLADFEVPLESLTFDECIGEGTFGTVYKGNWHGRVAIKVLKVDNRTEEQLSIFRNEAAVLMACRHDNILLFMGACTLPPKLCLITEWCEGSTLFRKLYVEDGEPLTIANVASVAYECALGLSYLHAKQIVHRDLKSANIFLVSQRNHENTSDTYSVRIGDFGLAAAKTSLSTEQHTTAVGSILWMAPEMIRRKPDENIDFFCSDVYSYGIVVYELLTTELPYKGLIPDQILLMVGMGLVAPDWSKARTDAQSEMVQLAVECTNKDPMRRPSFKTVAMLMGELHKKALADASNSTTGDVFQQPHSDTGSTHTMREHVVDRTTPVTSDVIVTAGSVSCIGSEGAREGAREDAGEVHPGDAVRHKTRSVDTASVNANRSENMNTFDFSRRESTNRIAFSPLQKMDSMSKLPPTSSIDGVSGPLGLSTTNASSSSRKKTFPLTPSSSFNFSRKDKDMTKTATSAEVPTNAFTPRDGEDIPLSKSRTVNPSTPMSTTFDFTRRAKYDKVVGTGNTSGFNGDVSVSVSVPKSTFDVKQENDDYSTNETTGDCTTEALTSVDEKPVQSTPTNHLICDEVDKRLPVGGGMCTAEREGYSTLMRVRRLSSSIAAATSEFLRRERDSTSIKRPQSMNMGASWCGTASDGNGSGLSGNRGLGIKRAVHKSVCRAGSTTTPHPKETAPCTFDFTRKDIEETMAKVKDMARKKIPSEGETAAIISPPLTFDFTRKDIEGTMAKVRQLSDEAKSKSESTSEHIHLSTGSGGVIEGSANQSVSRNMSDEPTQDSATSFTREETDETLRTTSASNSAEFALLGVKNGQVGAGVGAKTSSSALNIFERSTSGSGSVGSNGSGGSDCTSQTIPIRISHTSLYTHSTPIRCDGMMHSLPSHAASVSAGVGKNDIDTDRLQEVDEYNEGVYLSSEDSKQYKPSHLTLGAVRGPGKKSAYGGSIFDVNGIVHTADRTVLKPKKSRWDRKNMTTEESYSCDVNLLDGLERMRKEKLAEKNSYGSNNGIHSHKVNKVTPVDTLNVAIRQHKYTSVDMDETSESDNENENITRRSLRFDERGGVGGDTSISSCEDNTKLAHRDKETGFDFGDFSAVQDSPVLQNLEHATPNPSHIQSNHTHSYPIAKQL
eukprot:CFRG5905T1